MSKLDQIFLLCSESLPLPMLWNMHLAIIFFSELEMYIGIFIYSYFTYY